MDKEKKKKKEKRIVIIVLAVLLILVTIVGIYRHKKINLLDKSAYNTLVDQLEEDSIDINSQAELCEYIVNWARENNLNCTTDEAQNIIISRKAAATKKNIAPTVTVCNYNYENTNDARRVLSSAALIAQTELNSGKSTVIFVNNDTNDGTAYMQLDSKYFPDNAKVIFLDAGKMSYISQSSFSRCTQNVYVPSEKEEIKYDTAIKIHMGGVPSDLIDTSITNHTNFISLLSTVLNKLNSKSIKYQIVDLKLGNEGNKYPTSLDFTITLNSYSAATMAAYLDGRIESFNKNIDEDKYPNAEYSYEVINDISEISDTAYTEETSSALTVLLYTLKNGNYRFDEDSVIPEGYEASDVYAINCVNQIKVTDEEGIVVGISTQAIDKTYMNMIKSDNKTAAKLSGCTFKSDSYFKAYENTRNALSKTLQYTYFKVCDLSMPTLNISHDTYFTAMTYLDMINSNMDIVHIKMSSDTAKEITNMILCYIQTKGNLFSL